MLLIFCFLQSISGDTCDLTRTCPHASTLPVRVIARASRDYKFYNELIPYIHSYVHNHSSRYLSHIIGFVSFFSKINLRVQKAVNSKDKLFMGFFVYGQKRLQ